MHSLRRATVTGVRETMSEEEKKEKEQEEHFEGPWWRYPPLRNALMSGVLLALDYILSRLELLPVWAEITLYSIAIIIGGYYWAKEGTEKLIKKLEIGIEVLMAAATIGAAILGAWAEAAFLVFLYASAEGVEGYAFDRTRSAIRALLNLVPKEAIVLRDGQEIVVSAHELMPGDLFLVKPGESFATDGIVYEGASSVDESPITGE
ncbi:MAG: cation-transporting P-type ATPase, partial [Actinobacteria bacterium]|nr:cation-transporting P-type ATPase [Actinomycetota bacterium]